MNSKIKIPISKIRVVLLIVGAALFIVAGYYMLWNIFGILSISFFGMVGIYGLIKLFDFKPGLEINSKGIIENTNATSIGMIKWSDIYNIRSEQFGSQSFIMIDLIDPEKYINQASNVFKSTLMKINMRMYGTPISINSLLLSYNFLSLEKILQEEFKKYKTLH